jgi:hypothetical protein
MYVNTDDNGVILSAVIPRFPEANIFSLNQFCHFCGSLSAWVLIDSAVLYPDPYWECGSRSRRMEMYKKYK